MLQEGSVHLEMSLSREDILARQLANAFKRAFAQLEEDADVDAATDALYQETLVFLPPFSPPLSPEAFDYTVDYQSRDNAHGYIFTWLGIPLAEATVREGFPINTRVELVPVGIRKMAAQLLQLARK